MNKFIQKPENSPKDKRDPFIETLEDNGVMHYFVSEFEDGKALIIIYPKYISVLTNTGWDETSHSGLKDVTLSKNKKQAIVHYADGKTKEIEIPEIDFTLFTLTEEIIDKVIVQMKEEGTDYWDDEEEYINGVNVTYKYSKRKKSFIQTNIDVIVGSFMEKNKVSEKSMKDVIRETSNWFDLKSQGFKF